MKLKLTNGIVNKRTPAVLCVFAGVCLLTTAMTYRQITTTLDSSDRASELTLKLLAAEQDNMLLRQIAGGKEEYARNFLTSALAFNLKEVASLSSGVEDSRREFALQTIKVIERQKKQSAETYLVSNQRNGSATVAAH